MSKYEIELTPLFSENEIEVNEEFYTVKLKNDQIVNWETFATMRQMGFNVISLDLDKMELTFENIHKRF